MLCVNFRSHNSLGQVVQIHDARIALKHDEIGLVDVHHLTLREVRIVWKAQLSVNKVPLRLNYGAIYL